MILYAGMSISIWREKGQKEKKVKFVLLHLMAFISWVLVVYTPAEKTGEALVLLSHFEAPL